jgi:cytochrome c553
MRCQFDMLSMNRMQDRARKGRKFVAALAAAAAVVIAQPVLAAEPVPAKKVVDLAKGKATAAAVCAACHMPDGNSMIPQNPSLAAQHAGYLEKQLHNFRVKPGAKVAERENAVMAGFAAMLTPEDISNLSAFYAQQTPKSAAPKRKELVAAGERIYRAGVAERGVPACAGCHSPNGAGIGAQNPRLAGQHPEYLESTLNNFRLGQRKNSAQMMTIAGKMTEADIAAVSEYIASMR